MGLRLSRRGEGLPVRRERGATLVEAAIVFPLFLAVMIITIKLMIISYRALRFQYAVAEATRDTFTKTKLERGNQNYLPYLKTALFTRARDAGIYEAVVPNATEDTFFNQYARCTPSELCANPLPSTSYIGTIFTVRLDLQEPLLWNEAAGQGTPIAGISLPKIPLTAQGIAVIQMQESE